MERPHKTLPKLSQIRFQKITRKLSPKKEVYTKYLQEAKRFCITFDSLQTGIPVNKREFVKAVLVRSELFNKQYLCIHAKKSWFNKIAPKCDALATTSIILLGVFDSPPAIVVPVGKKFKDPKIRSILEHEVVHVNQAILKCFPSDFHDGDGDLCQAVLNFTLSEYEANYLQLAKWPMLFPKIGLSIEEWCVLRGYTQALEQFILRGLQNTFSEKKFFATIKKLEKKSEQMFFQLGASREVAQQFARATYKYSAQAIGNIPNDFSIEASLRFLKFLQKELIRQSNIEMKQT